MAAATAMAAFGTVTAGALTGQDAAAASAATSGTSSITLQITNDSSRALHYVGDSTVAPGNTISPAPADTIAPNGGTDTIHLTSTSSEGADMDLFYRIDGTEKQLDGHFQVPTIGFNEAACTGYKGGPGCHIDGGYHPNAAWTIRTSDTEAVSLGSEEAPLLHGIRMPLRHFRASTTEFLTCCLARRDPCRGPGDSPASTPLVLASLGPL